MVKSPKNKKKQHSRSTSLQVNAPTQCTPSGPTQRTTRVVADAITGMRQMLSSGSKAMQRGKSQDSSATAQQGDASTTAQQGDASTIANAPSAKALDSNNPGTNATQECGVMDPNTSLLSELGSRALWSGTNTTNQFSPITSQVATPTQDTTLPGFNPSTPPRLDASGIGGVTEVGTDLLDDQGATTSSASVVGMLIDAPSPR